jgi:hypothetical protein
MCSPRGSGCLVNDLPNLFGKLEVLHILGNVIKSVQQVPRVRQGFDRRPTQRSGRPQPIQTTNLNQNAIRGILERHGKGCVPPGARTRPRPDLNNQMIGFSKNLRFQVAMVELSLQGLGHICGAEISMKYSLFHLIDYNRRAILICVYI